MQVSAHPGRGRLGRRTKGLPANESEGTHLKQQVAVSHVTVEWLFVPRLGGQYGQNLRHTARPRRLAWPLPAQQAADKPDAVKGTGFSPYISSTRQPPGLSPRGTTSQEFRPLPQAVNTTVVNRRSPEGAGGFSPPKKAANLRGLQARALAAFPGFEGNTTVVLAGCRETRCRYRTGPDRWRGTAYPAENGQKSSPPRPGTGAQARRQRGGFGVEAAGNELRPRQRSGAPHGPPNGETGKRKTSTAAALKMENSISHSL